MSETPDLTFYFLIHRAMRDSSAQLRCAIGSLEDGDRRRAAAIGSWFAGFNGELHHHHTVEDEVFFPALAARVPCYAESYSDELAEDHLRLDGLLTALTAGLADLSGEGEWDAAHMQALIVASQLADLLDRHLRVEDEDVVPLFGRHFSAVEYEAMHAQAVKTMQPKQALFTLPWIMGQADADERREMLADAPAAMKLIWRASRRGYAKRAAYALGDHYVAVGDAAA
jgi:hypothetical protein